jgi:hypothetical protein
MEYQNRDGRSDWSSANMLKNKRKWSEWQDLNLRPLRPERK